jgi:hypothetical protein
MNNRPVSVGSGAGGVDSGLVRVILHYVDNPCAPLTCSLPLLSSKFTKNVHLSNSTMLVIFKNAIVADLPSFATVAKLAPAVKGGQA